MSTDPATSLGGPSGPTGPAIPNPNLVLYATGLVGPSGPTAPTGPGFDAIRQSGFTSVIVWALHVHPNGDLQFGGTPTTSWSRRGSSSRSSRSCSRRSRR